MSVLTADFASARRDKKKAFDKRHKATVARLADRVQAQGEDVYDALLGKIERQIWPLSLGEIAGDWSLDPRVVEPLFDQLRLALLGARVIGSGQFWDDLRSLGFARWLADQDVEVELPITWGNASLRALFVAAAWDEVPPLKDDDLLKWFEAKTPHTRSTFDQLSQIDKTNAFTIAGAESQALVAEVKMVALDAIKLGSSKRDFMKAVREAFDGKEQSHYTDYIRQ